MPRDLRKRQSNASSDGHIPRPANCFMVFRADWAQELYRQFYLERGVVVRSRRMSHRGTAAAWNSLPPTLKRLTGPSRFIKDEHIRKYPGWFTDPIVKRKSRVVDDDGPSAKRVVRDPRSHAQDVFRG